MKTEQKKQQIGISVWSILFTVLIFQRVIEQYFPMFSIVDEIFALSCVPMGIFDLAQRYKKGESIRATKSRLAGAVLFVVFVAGGIFANVLYQFQPWSIVAVSVVLSVKFFLLIESAGLLNQFLPFQLEKQGLAVSVLSFLWFGYFLLTRLYPAYFEEMYVWDVCAKCALLFALLIFCEHKNIWLYRAGVVMMLIMLVSTGKEKVYGGIILFLALYYIVVHKLVKVKIKYFLYIAIPIIMIAWEKIYYYYVEGHGQYAKSLMTETAFRIAGDYFPIGTGFGTYGSTYAMLHYSPVYQLYGLSDNPQLGIQTKMYLNDVFWPILFGENGVLGTICYVGILLLLFIAIQKMYYYNKKKYFLALYLYVYVLMTTFSETGFMQPSIMMMAVVLGILLGEYRMKCQDKLKMFYAKDRIGKEK